MYAKFVAYYEASGQVEWLKKFMPGLRVVDSIQRPLRMYCDNESAVFYVVKEKIQNHSITLEHISTKKMLADPLTKGLPPNVFIEHIAGMGLRESL